jgi:hypothetical protein
VCVCVCVCVCVYVCVCVCVQEMATSHKGTTTINPAGVFTLGLMNGPPLNIQYSGLKYETMA